MITDKPLITECREAWEGLQWFRRRRRRCKDFAYGRQWGDSVRLPDGRIVSEERRMLEAGRPAVTNNLIGRMIKQIIGYYRHLSREEADADARVALTGTFSRLEATDARALEEFLISGMAVQRVGREEDGWLPCDRVSNRSPERVFFRRFAEPDGADARFVGLLHDLSLSTLTERFAGSDSRGMDRIAGSFRRYRGASVPCMPGCVDFSEADIPDLTRVIEVWRLRYIKVMEIFDPSRGRLYTGVADAAASRRFEETNRRRKGKGQRPLAARTRRAEVWEESWLLADGTLLERAYHPRRTRLPIAMRLYPMVDGEVHSLVESVIDQQKFVNRLVGLLDEILGASAKGAVLYPVDQLPDGMTWQELRRLWSSPSAILPFKRTSKSIQPRQLSGGGSCSGATELLKTQLSLFDDISGSGGIFSGGGRADGADMARLQRDGAAIAMLDILSAFREFVKSRPSVG